MAKEVPDKNTQTWISIIALIAIIAGYMIDSTPSIFYGTYGASLMGGICALVAYLKNRNPFAWFALGLWFVLVSFVIILFLPKLHKALCPFCREGVAHDASVCPHCQRDLDLVEKA